MGREDRSLHKTKIDWDDPIPHKLKDIWTAFSEDIEERSSLEFQRAVVAEDACSLNIQPIDDGDVREKLVFAAIYTRFKL